MNDTDRIKMLEAFASHVAHEIKAPLGSIALRVQKVLVREATDNCARQDLERVMVNVNTITSVVDELLELALAQEKPKTGRAKLTSIIEYMKSEVALQYHNAITMLVQPYNQNIELACTDGGLLTIYSNLVNNSIKFMPGPLKVITTRVLERDKTVRVEVEDTGPGIDPATIDVIFEPRVRINYSIPGLGLGLAIVKELVEGYGGSVGVYTAIAGGACFWFELQKHIAPA